jgi:hypothetical protein
MGSKQAGLLWNNGFLQKKAVFKRLQEMIRNLFTVPISEGGLHYLLNRLASKGLNAYEMIRQNVMKIQVIDTDETGMKVNGKKNGS